MKSTLYVVSIICTIAFCGLAVPVHQGTAPTPMPTPTHSKPPTETSGGAVWDPEPIGVQYGRVCMDSIYVRGGPSTDYPIIGHMDRGTPVIIRETVGRWGRTDHNGYVYLGYICRENIPLVTPSAKYDDETPARDPVTARDRLPGGFLASGWN